MKEIVNLVLQTISLRKKQNNTEANYKKKMVSDSLHFVGVSFRPKEDFDETSEAAHSGDRLYRRVIDENYPNFACMEKNRGMGDEPFR